MKVDGFVDGLITVGFLDLRWKRLDGAVLLSICMLRFFISDSETVSRDDLLALNKLLEEGSLEETKAVSGSLLDIRGLTVALPDDKHKEWITQIKSILSAGSCTPVDLESLIGRLNHAAFVIPNSRHILNRLRNLLSRFKKHRKIILTPETISNLHLWELFLLEATNHISVNLVVERWSDHALMTNSCEHAIGGFSLKNGRAFLYEIPDYLRFKVSNNVSC